MKILFFFFIPLFTWAQVSDSTFEGNINKAFNNAKKGMYFAFANIPAKKNDLSKELIEEDKLLARVKLSKAVNGVKVESTGIYNSYEICITAFRTYESLLKDGYIKYIPKEESF